ncbi:MAG: tRNA (adenosine(37)-N6)-dimethylallyltransferase MiaA [Xanthomonadaceae bacterium]|nr:tRNA (adenosine(37)-N6)-dimethylallyltransferase MiaA [Xanthomonadaceae bacterium]
MSNIDARPLAIFLMGPTASGKTALACELAQRFALDLISVDSALVYRGLDIGAAKPDAATLAEFPHRLIDIRDPAQPYSAAEFRADALREMESISTAGRIPLLVGGTGLYFRALQSGLSQLPEADADLRARLTDEAARLGWPVLHARLQHLDPVAAKKIRPGDAQRIQRALEVMALTGKPLSGQQGGMPAPFPYRVLKLALVPDDRAVLHERIAQRMDVMIAQGLLDEVRVLRSRGDLHADLPAFRAVGYRQAWQHLNGQFDATEFRDRAVFATRQLAKRQLTWLRGELDVLCLDPSVSGRAVRAVQDFLAALG